MGIPQPAGGEEWRETAWCRSRAPPSDVTAACRERAHCVLRADKGDAKVSSVPARRRRRRTGDIFPRAEVRSEAAWVEAAVVKGSPDGLGEEV